MSTTNKKRYAQRIAKVLESKQPLVKAAPKEGISRNLVYKYLGNPDSKALVEHERQVLRDKGKSIVGISKTGLDRIIRLLNKHIDTIQSSNTIGSNDLDDLLRIAQTLAGTLKVSADIGLEDTSNDFTPEDREEAALQLVRAMVKGIMLALSDPVLAGIVLDRLLDRMGMTIMEDPQADIDGSKN